MTRRLAGVLVAAVVLAFAGCGGGGGGGGGGSSKPSPEETAKTNGEAVGKAAKQLTSARNLSDIEAGVAGLQSALKTVQKNVKDKGGDLQDQISSQETKLKQSVTAVTNAVSSADIGGLVSAASELQSDVNGLAANAKSLASNGSSVAKSFWDGVQQGFDDS